MVLGQVAATPHPESGQRVPAKLGSLVSRPVLVRHEEPAHAQDQGTGIYDLCLETTNEDCAGEWIMNRTTIYMGNDIIN